VRQEERWVQACKEGGEERAGRRGRRQKRHKGIVILCHIVLHLSLLTSTFYQNARYASDAIQRTVHYRRQGSADTVKRYEPPFTMDFAANADVVIRWRAVMRCRIHMLPHDP